MTNSPPRRPAFWRRPIPPAMALWFIAPIIGEMVSGSTPLDEYISPFTALIQSMLYGSGAILVREFIVRQRKGWPSLLLLGLAYGIYEEGLVVRSFFDPQWMDLGHLGVYGRVAGVNWVWTEHLMVYHAVISIAASITLASILFPNRRSESWIGPRGLIWNVIAFSAMLPLGALLNPHDTPDAWLGAAWFAMGLLGLAAWRRPAAREAASERAVPRPRRFWWTGFLGALGQNVIAYRPAEVGSPHFLITMLIMALFDLMVLWLVLRWSGGANQWDDRHRLALISGALSVFLLIGPLALSAQHPVVWFTSPAFLLLLWWIYRRVDRRVHDQAPALAAQPGD